VLDSTPSYELNDSAAAKFYCKHTLADHNKRNQITERMLEGFSIVLQLHCLHTMKK